MCVKARLSFAVGAVVACVLGCSDDAEPALYTQKINYDGQTYEFDSDASCVRRADGRLQIVAPVPARGSDGPVDTERGKKLIRVELFEVPVITIRLVAFRFYEIRGFTEETEAMWGTKVDNVFTVNGSILDDDGVRRHQIQLTVTCPDIRDRDGR